MHMNRLRAELHHSSPEGALEERSAEQADMGMEKNEGEKRGERDVVSNKEPLSREQWTSPDALNKAGREWLRNKMCSCVTQERVVRKRESGAGKETMQETE